MEETKGRAEYEWVEGEAKDTLMRNGMQVGSVRMLGQIWVSNLWPPSKRRVGQADREENAVRGATVTRQKAQEITLRNARYYWDGVTVEDANEMTLTLNQ